MNISDSKGLLGCLCVFSSAFCFYLATATIRWSKVHVALDISLFVFGRLALGFVMVCLILILKKQRIKPRRYDLLLARTIANCMALFCFYKAVDVTSVANANILNMTFPIFVTLFSWAFLKDQRDVVAIGIVLVAFVGIWLILSPGDIRPDLNNLWGLASGIFASFAIIFLNISRKYHDTETILFFLFGLGALVVFILFYDRMVIPGGKGLYYLVLCSLFGIVGQYLMTLGFRYVTAVEGSIISSARILLAALLGPYVAFDLPLTMAGWTGAVLIFCANVYLTLRKARRDRAQAPAPGPR